MTLFDKYLKFYLLMWYLAGRMQSFFMFGYFFVMCVRVGGVA